jgi:hypothetical protein
MNLTLTLVMVKPRSSANPLLYDWCNTLNVAEVDCIYCMLKIMPNNAIHTEVTTLCNITFAEHLGILLMLRSYSCALNVYFTIIQNIWPSMTLLYSLINPTICCDTDSLTVQTAAIQQHYLAVMSICYPEFHTSSSLS